MNPFMITGLALPETVLYGSTGRVLMAFVAVNTIMYGSLSVAKMLPKVHLVDLSRRGRDQRGEDRSIYPDNALAASPTEGRQHNPG